MTDKQKKTEIIGFPLINGNGSKTTCIEELTLDFFTFHSKDLEGLKAVLDSISSYEVFMAPKDIKKSFKDLIAATLVAGISFILRSKKTFSFLIFDTNLRPFLE